MRRRLKRRNRINWLKPKQRSSFGDTWLNTNVSWLQESFYNSRVWLENSWTLFSSVGWLMPSPESLWKMSLIWSFYGWSSMQQVQFSRDSSNSSLALQPRESVGTSGKTYLSRSLAKTWHSSIAEELETWSLGYRQTQLKLRTRYQLNLLCWSRVPFSASLSSLCLSLSLGRWLFSH